MVIPKDQTLEQWLDQVADWNSPTSYGFLLYHTLRQVIAPRSDPALDPLPEPITYRYTANRAFEVAYWNTIARLATGRVRQQGQRRLRARPGNAGAACNTSTRDLDALGDWLLAHYRKLIARHGMRGKALAGELPFRWQTDFDFPWMDGWLRQPDGERPGTQPAGGDPRKGSLAAR